MKDFNGFMKGVDLGGWFSQCIYTEEHYDTFITEDDFKELSTWGIDHVRIPIDFNLVETEDGSYIEKGFLRIRNAVDLCAKYHLNMVLDLHKTAGYSFDAGEAETGFFENRSLQERFYRLWEELAKHFGKDSHVAFELLNEVTDASYSDTWNEVANNCIKRIRPFAPDTYILVGGYWNNSIDAMPDLKVENDGKIVYNFHFYEPLIFTHQRAYWVDNMPTNLVLKYPEQTSVYLKEHKRVFPDMDCALSYHSNEICDTDFMEARFALAVKIAEEHDVPLYCGEYGVINLVDTDSTLKWYQSVHTAFEKLHIGRSAWSYKKMDFGLSDDHMKPIFEEIKKCL